jgi:ribosomal protein L37AE/L43A
MSAGKGDSPRAVNGEAYRRNFDAIFSRSYPDWICAECGRKHGKRPDGNPYGATWHIDTCGVCDTSGIEVTECRDFGHLKEGWDK